MPETTWQCPFCNSFSAVGNPNRSITQLDFYDGNKHGRQIIKVWTTTCLNPQCREYTLQASAHDVSSGGATQPDRIHPAKITWRLIPAANVRVFPEYVPEPILTDYREAALIQATSPKAAATLARRCLQGMIRDFWAVRQDNLAKAIEAIRANVDPLTWDAIDSVRRIGNIGAHMEKDINVVIDVDPGEAQLLIELIETLINDWYVLRHERQQRLANVIAIADAKSQAKSNPPGSATGAS